MIRRAVSGIAALLLASAAVTAQDKPTTPNWPSWRGPTASGATEGNPPVSWGEDKNIKWKIAVPGKGLSTPIVWGDLLFIQTAVEMKDAKPAADGAQPAADNAPAATRPPQDPPRGQRQGRGGGGFGRGTAPTTKHQFLLLAYNRNTGKEVWRTKVAEEVPHEGTHGDGTFASNSPVTDGKHVWAYFGSRGIHCIDMDGKIVWQKSLGKMRTKNSFGEGSSPTLHGDTVLVAQDHEGESFLFALDKMTGKEIWKMPRQEQTTWSTPLVATHANKSQVIIPATGATRSYDLATGKLLWQCNGMTSNVIPSPIYSDGVVYVMSGFRGNKAQAINLDKASGDISDGNAFNWSLDRGTPYVPSPLLYNKTLYFLSGNTGMLTSVDAATGKVQIDRQRLEGVRGVYSSPVGAGGHVYIFGRDGSAVVIKDGAEFKIVATNKLEDEVDASPAIIGDTMYVRGRKSLYAISATK